MLDSGLDPGVVDVRVDGPRGYRPAIVRELAIPAEGPVEPIVVALARCSRVEVSLGGRWTPSIGANHAIALVPADRVSSFGIAIDPDGVVGNVRSSLPLGWVARVFLRPNSRERAEVDTCQPGPHRLLVFPPDLVLDPAEIVVPESGSIAVAVDVRPAP
jgi:hypothetical protein